MDSSKLELNNNNNNNYIQALNLFKFYNYDSTVLNSLNINIPKGKIYALLGESGCGKTTLLKCLIGILPIDKGNIIIFGDKTDHNYGSYRIDLSKLGFMPQDQCLYSDLTINETFYYFAKLNSMNNNRIKERKNFLLSLLNLPKQNKLIKHLSTGQIKRVSFGCSLIHEPTILMLDEPTVGLDPILRRKIWDYLIDLSNLKQTTIIITTHYIDEARYANNVGFMRYGRIIEENNPNQLLTKYNEKVLEDVFYKICKEEDSLNNKEESLLNNKLTNDNNLEDKNFLKTKLNNYTRCLRKTMKSIVDKKRTKNFNSSQVSLNRINGLLFKDIKKCQRNKSLLVVQLLVPLIQITLFCLCIGKTPINLNVGFVNNDKPNDTFSIGSLFIHKLDNKIINKKQFNDINEAFDSLKKGDIWSFITIDNNFTIDLLTNLNKSVFQQTYKNKIHIYMDNTNHQISYTIRDTILASIKTLIEDYSVSLKSILTDESTTNDDILDIETIRTTNQINYPIIFEDPVYGVKEPVFTHFMAPGIAITVVFFLSVAATASNFVLERRLGLLERSYLSGIKTIELLISQIIVYSIMLIIQITIVLMLLFLVFDLPLRGSLIALVILIFLQGFSGLCYGLMITSLCSTEETVIQLTLASFYPILLMSGIIWPIEAQPQFLAQISKFLPLTYATDAFRCILEKGWSLFMFKVYLGFITTFAWIFIFLIGFLLIFSLKIS